MRSARKDRLAAIPLALVVFVGSCAPVQRSAGPTAILLPTLGAGQPAPRPTAGSVPLLPRGLDVNPLTGEPVADASLLKIPAVLVSISHFPATARPQSGLSFASFVYEYYITEGATRYLAVFYGEFPQVESQVEGGCETRVGPIPKTAAIIGNLVWHDANGNGLQDPGEGGISGLCVNLFDSRDNLIERTSTDSNGFYAFNVTPGAYSVEFKAPPSLTFTRPRAGDPGRDSDADPDTGRVPVTIASDDVTIDAGLVVRSGSSLPAASQSELPPAQVGPIRSGRLMYRYIAQYFENSCLIFGSASPEVLALLPKCLIVFHQIYGGGYMLDLTEMRSVALENQRKSRTQFDYSGNRFDPTPMTTGSTASEVRAYFAYQNQSGWYYDAGSQSYLRYVDTSEYDEAGIIHPEVDRLTGRQLHYENLIVLFASHQEISPTNLDIHLDPGKTGDALLFRDGRVEEITWATTSLEQAETSAMRPIRFLGQDGHPAALRPGHTWITVVTPETTVEQTEPGKWLLTFVPPVGAK
ncbi:MAG: SdrD B-like domain-containing protein [Anaerolineales bacterium]